jgi:Holliday junction DNA helicase RuvA
MIGRLRGILASRREDIVLVDVAGVGYEAMMTPRDLANLPQVGEEVVVHTHLHVREDVQALYGFGDEESRDLFRRLIGASGVGPKLAMSVLATFTPDDLRIAILNEDVDALTAVPGVGKRSAQKLILELRARLALPDGGIPAGSPLGSVREALENLGYASSEIREAVDGLSGDDVEKMLRTALQRLGKS